MVCPPDAPMIRQRAWDGAWFGDPERSWLERLAKIIVTFAGATSQVLDNESFIKLRGAGGALRNLGADAAVCLAELNTELPA